MGGVRVKTLQPNAENASISEIEVAMECAPKKRSYIRLAAIRALLLGYTREQAGQLFHRSDRMVQLWIHRFNARGIDGLIYRPGGGAPRSVSLEAVREVVEPLLEDPSRAEKTYWTGKTLHGYLKQELQKDFGYSTCLRYFKELNLTRSVPRSWPEGQDEQQRQTFIKELRELAADPKVQLWFGDECGVEGDPRPRPRWVKRGSRPKVGYTGAHLRSSVIGAVAPETGELVSLIFNHCDTEVFQIFLDHLAQVIPKDPGKRQILILDNASWHKTRRLHWHHIEVKYLPPYSPDLNPIERLWLRLKADWFADFIAPDRETLDQRICEGLRSFIDTPSQTASICSITK